MAIRYQRIADDLRQQITSGALAAGEQLPVEPDLAHRYGVSTPTLRRALDILQAEGLVEKRHGSGNFVRRPLQRIEYASDRLSGERSTDDPRLQVSVSSREVKADEGISSLMDVRKGSPLIEHTYLSQSAGLPYCLVTVYLAHGTWALHRFRTVSPWADNVRESLTTSGVSITGVAERAVARHPTENEAMTLRLTPGIPVLAIERRSTDTSGRVVEGALLVLPGDRAEARYTALPLPKVRR